MHVDTVVFRSEAVLIMPAAIRPESLLVDEENTNHHLMDVKRPHNRHKKTAGRINVTGINTGFEPQRSAAKKAVTNPPRFTVCKRNRQPFPGPAPARIGTTY